MARLAGSKLVNPFIGAIIFAWLIFCWHWLCGADVIPFDSKLTYFQLSSWVVDCYRAGSLPLWNPYFMSGFPACADPQIHCFYLFAMPFFALLGPLQPIWFDRVELLHILAAGIGFFFLARAFKITPMSAAMTSLLVMFGGSASARLQHTGMIYAYGLLPWCLLLTKYVFERTSLWYVLALGVVAGSMGILGDQVAFLNCLIVAAFAATLLLQALWLKKRIVPSFARLLVAAAITLLVMLPQIIPTAELLPLSSRPWIALEKLRMKSLYPWSFLTYLIPDLFRTFDGYENYIGKNDPSETYLYIGLLPATIMLYGGILKGLLFRKQNLWFVAPLVFFVLYALGTQTPAYAVFWNLIPGVKSFQRPTDATFAINVFLALLIGWLLDKLRGNAVFPNIRVLPTTLVAMSFTTTVLIITIVLCKYKVPHVLLENNIAAFLKLGIMVLLSTIIIRALERTRDRGIQNLLISLIALISFCDLTTSNSANFLNTATEKTYAYTDPHEISKFPALKVLSQLSSPSLEPYRVEMLGSESENQWWNTSSHLKVQATDGMWPINLLSYHQYAGACNPLFGRKFNHWMSGFDSPLFDLLNVKYVLTNYGPEKAQNTLDPNKFKPVSKLNQYTVYENSKVLPRSFLASKYKICNSVAELGNVIKNSQFNPASEVVFLADDVSTNAKLFDSIKPSVGTSEDKIQWIRSDANQQILSVHCSDDRILFLGDIYFPGWTATIDDVPTRILRADYLFRAILLTKGDHGVRFSYAPYSLEALRETSRLAQSR